MYKLSVRLSVTKQLTSSQFSKFYAISSVTSYLMRTCRAQSGLLSVISLTLLSVECFHWCHCPHNSMIFLLLHESNRDLWLWRQDKDLGCSQNINSQNVNSQNVNSQNIKFPNYQLPRMSTPKMSTLNTQQISFGLSMPVPSRRWRETYLSRSPWHRGLEDTDITINSEEGVAALDPVHNLTFTMS